MFCGFFHLLVYYSLANKDPKHFNPNDKRISDQIQRKLSSNIEFKKTPKEIKCPDFIGDAFTEIVDGVSDVAGNLYACNRVFRNPIKTSSLLQIYHCKFVNFDTQRVPITVTKVSGGNVLVSNCEFIICKDSIQITEVLADIKITNCYFTHCEPSSSIIQIKSDSGTIENCYFRDNYGIAIKYYPDNIGDNRLTIKSCVCQVSFSKENFLSKSHFLDLKVNSKIDFSDCDFYYWADDNGLTANSRIFSNKINNPNEQIFKNINMYPLDDKKIGSTLPTDFTIGNGESMDCPEDLPDGMSSVPPNFFCGNIGIGDTTGSTLINSVSFVQVHYSSFSSFKNTNGNGGAAYLKVPSQTNIDKALSIKFYHSVFMDNAAQNGCAIYIESDDQDRLFDFYQCTFEQNRLSSGSSQKAIAGGAIYIKSFVSSFKFTDCQFTTNYAIDGGAIYYLSDGDANAADTTTPSLQVSDCSFFRNYMSNTGGSLSINIKNNPSPKPVVINNCTFSGNQFYDDDKTIHEAEYGGAIYYEYQSSELSADQTYNHLHIFDCIFLNNVVTIFGGAISLLINCPDNLIEIEKCSFNGNYAYFYNPGAGTSGNGGAIHCIVNQATQTTKTDPSLNIHDCNFTNCFAYDQGGSIAILVKNAQSSRPIAINNCLFDDIFDSNSQVKSKVTKNGVFLSYVIEPLSDSPLSNHPPLHISGCDFKQNMDGFEDTDEVEKGGCIYLLINNCQQTGGITIDYCTFSHKQSSATESYGGSIYYQSNADAGSTPNNEVLSITNSVFDESNVLNYGGSIYIDFTGESSQKEISLNNCSFKRTTSTRNNDAVYIKSDKKPNNVKFTGCTFDSCMIYFNALSTTIENCQFNEIASDKHAIFYASEYTEDFSISLKIDACHFTQTSTVVDSLVYFDKKLSSKFIFTNNNIKFTDTTSHVLGCTKDIEIKEETEENTYWEFSNNNLDPNEEEVIKTDNAIKIPAFCMKGFSCIANCANNTHCELKGEEDVQNFKEKELIDFSYNGLTPEGEDTKNGGAIHLINYRLKCVNSHFTGCKAEQGGGGAIFIVTNKEPSEKASFAIEKCDFNGCIAQFGGAIYIYSSQQNCDFQITRCIFDSNKVSTAAPEGSTAENSHLFGGAAAYLQTQNSKLIRCTFRQNTGNDVKIYQTDGLNPPSSSSMILNSESSIQISECIFESDKSSSSSSLFFVDKKTKNNTPLSVVNCKFVGELPEGAYHIDGESMNKKKLNIMVEKCKFASDRKIALNSKLNVLSFDLKSQQFNYKENESYSQDSLKKRRTGFNLLALVAVEVSAVIVASLAIVIIIKKKKASQVESSDNDEKVIEQNKAEL